jgi:anaerobic selenocysteine-containing dehydrogenase
MGQLHTQAGFAIMPLKDDLPGFYTPTRKVEIWSTIVETYLGDEGKDYILPDYVPGDLSKEKSPDLYEEYPILLTTGSRAPTFFHSEHRQLPWCRELWPVPRVEINPKDAEKLGITQGDWVWIENDQGKVRQVADLYWGIDEGVANANHQWWYPELDQPGHGFELSAINMLQTPSNQDPICGASALRAYPVKIYKATAENSPNGNPVPCGNDGQEIITSPSDPRLKAWMATDEDYEGRTLS